MFNRREAVSRIAMMVGGAFTAPTLFAMDVKESGKFLNADLFSLTDAQRQVVELQTGTTSNSSNTTFTSGGNSTSGGSSIGGGGGY